MTPYTGLKFGEMEFGEMKRNTSNWSNFCTLPASASRGFDSVSWTFLLKFVYNWTSRLPSLWGRIKRCTRPFVCLSVHSAIRLRFSRNRKAIETSNLVGNVVLIKTNLSLVLPVNSWF